MIKLIVIFFSFSLFSFCSENILNCLVHEIYKLERFFGPLEVSTYDITPIVGGTSVYKVVTKSGEAFIMRRASRTDNVKREIFANLFLKDSSAPNAPDIQLFSIEDSQRLLSNVRRFDNPSADEQVSIAKFSKGVLGETYLKSKGNLLFMFLNELKEVRSSDFDEYKLFIHSRFDSLWSGADKDGKKTIYEILKRYIPELEDVKNAGDIPGVVKNNSKKLLGVRPDPYRDFEIFKSNLPKKIKSDLADSWAMYTILGIHDFHDKNWLINNNRVVPIDLAYPVFKKNRLGQTSANPLAIDGQHFPYHHLSLNDNYLINSLINDISGETRLYIKSLSKEKIKAMSVQSGYLMPSYELEDIWERVEYLKDILK